MNQNRYTLLMIGFGFLIAIPVHAQFVTIARKIKSMRTSQADVASVILEAKTFRVYKAVIDTLAIDPKVKITTRNDAKRFVEFNNATASISLQVDSLEAGLSQITVSAVHSANAPKQPTDMAVEAIVTVCHKAGIKCTLDKSSP